MKQTKKTKILLEMRPALEGFAGIPQETRLLFRGLRMLDDFEVEGMIQTSHRILAKGTSDGGLLFAEKSLSEGRKINRYSRVVISVAERPYNTVLDRLMDYMQRRMMSTQLTLKTLLGFGKVRLSNFRAKYFEDFIWRTLFAKTLPAADYDLVSTANQRICHTPWHSMHMAGLATLNFLPAPRYPMLSTPGVDIFIGQTPYPARVHRNTAFVVRYHDAIPVFMPHTISDKSLHQATHFYSLMSNVKSGAYFACVSEATRQDLIRLFPDAESRSVTIHNMVSHHYHSAPASRELVPGIIRSRLYGMDPDANGMGLTPDFLTLREQESFYARHLGSGSQRYMLVVSTIEPRKNHARLMAAWEVIKADIDPEMKLVIVGTLGWDFKQMVKSFRSWIDRGDLFMLNAVPAPDLRVLYQHATVTVCPSLGEGFDFSGVEAMSSGGVVVASDIPVHREVYDDAAEYFDPYSTASLVQAFRKVIYAEDAIARQQHLRERGQDVASRYQPDKILPRWNQFLEWVARDKGAAVLGRSTGASAKPLALRDLDGAASPQ
ncbi:glycosyltransferase involved in cell wall biosynthesis [Cupriavidus metallidurans]|uniref:glycosyltransferase family 4 protein n=2 Tax=Cupriavidus metallidurans TaxID=119219 RepID=UPI0006908019|nr:glycosyltransferase family 1 protein [Cupriavidus metallidurans]KWW39401.1 putative poly(glycerol-phosphate) alpha-glucosyltransferase [Cupriavidus metallidurans]MDE4920618.1 glycosyltransferase family 1 protein [Cupriavidus metallidurans]